MLMSAPRKNPLQRLIARRTRSLSGLGRWGAGPQPMAARAFKQGSNAWVDVTPKNGPVMRITHSIGGDYRNPPTFSGFAGLFGLGAASKVLHPRRNVRCIGAGQGRVYCWNVDTGAGAPFVSPDIPMRSARPGVRATRPAPTTMALTAGSGGLRPSIPPAIAAGMGVEGVNCRRAGDSVFCWDETAGDPASGTFRPLSRETSPLGGLRLRRRAR